jgi:hypothetical protein
MDLHLHTSASSDYRDPGVTYLDILKKAEDKGLDMIAFADHNTVGGYAAMHREIELLQTLEKLGRANDTERATLEEYRRLLGKIVVLPAFEFTATFGFHILGIFPESTSVRKLEYLLLDLNVPEDRMVIGAPDVGSTSDVLRAYQAISAAGGLAIAAHANSSNGVAMQGFPFGGQTKIAYTQDPNLAALEVTDLEATGRRTTAAFFNGSKPEYPRRMHIIQGSDAHSLETEQSDSANKRLGVGTRVTEILVKEASFAALRELLMGNDFTRIRPVRAQAAWEFAQRARAEGANIVQSFHERASTKTSRSRPILHDVVAFANTRGGTIYVGVNPDTKVAVHGVEHPEEAVRMLRADIQQSVEPPIEVEFDTHRSGERGVVLIKVPEGSETPYLFEPTGQIYVRDEDQTALASRDEIIGLVNKSQVASLRSQVSADEVRRETTDLQPAQRAVPVPATPQRERDERDKDRGRDRDRIAPAARAETPPAQTAPAQDRSARVPAFPNLPPEKIKGKVQPMATNWFTTAPQEDLPQIGGPEAQPDTEMFESEQITAPLSMEQIGGQAGSADTVKLEESKGKGRTRKGGKRDTTKAQPEAVAEEPQAAPRARGRSRRKGAEEAQKAETMMEATVASERETREEIVAEAAEKPKRGRKRKAADAELQVEAPTAAAAATEAGAEGILAQAAVEPGAQIPSELTGKDAAPKRGRSRRKKGEEQTEPEPTPEPVAEVAAEGKKPRRRGKKAEAEQGSQMPPPDPPSTGVEIVSTDMRNGVHYHTMRDLRNSSTVHNVTRHSARRLWHYAILQHERGLPEMAEVMWHDTLPIGLWRRGQRAGDMRYDMVLRKPDGSFGLYYGVTEEGLHGPWRDLVLNAESADYWGPDASDN